ncbi:Crp/Fnr family transcriptional regulator [Mucilaginibacter jinjuensis]|uniref:Crp/Fnr family transcriptional regulator n=1 Tax=Mucilaginibacter jinjuensis TaxID=1176721 RepID=A0ABY7TF73_9SPHI|nr:Crp/Fnr family transcriptional regulator [Mucilaginibacter jinjuensis]WCT14262.1 Crp/Fnr family transcriptional regulator [Mucilaginibacter jinjuensis]
MPNVQPLVDHIKKQMDLSQDEEEYLTSLLSVKTFRKRQFVDQPGYVSRYRNYVVSGALRAYVIGSDGQDHTISLAIEDWFIGDPGSYMSQESATLFVEAMEDCTLIQLSFDNEQLLMETMPKFERYFRIRAHKTAVNFQKRVLSNISETAEERYENFISKYPQLVSRFPLYVIASYLGMSREFLSRIRNTRSNQKTV